MDHLLSITVVTRENSKYFKGHHMDLDSAKNSLLGRPKQRTDELYDESFPTQL